MANAAPSGLKLVAGFGGDGAHARSFWRLFAFWGCLGLLSAWNLRSMTFGGNIRIFPSCAILGKTSERKAYGGANNSTGAASRWLISYGLTIGLLLPMEHQLSISRISRHVHQMVHRCEQEVREEQPSLRCGEAAGR